MPGDEVVVLVSDLGLPIGVAPKATVHSDSTPLHLGFSCYVRDSAGRVLLTRRALAKRTWPGVWTNAFCGHPGPDETFECAVARRAGHELGLTLTSLTCVLPDFRYRAVDASGVVENEICPVFVAVAAADPAPNPHEVMQWTWAETSDVIAATAHLPFAFSPWMGEQLGDPRLREALRGDAS